MKKLIIAIMVFALVACSNDTPPPPQQQVQYVQVPVQQQQPQQVVVQQAPQSDGAGAMIAGAALGAMAMHMATNNQPREREVIYRDAPTQDVHNVTNVKNVTNITNIKETPVPAEPKKAEPAQPISPCPITLAHCRLQQKVLPEAAKTSYAALGTATPVPTLKKDALTAPKEFTMPAKTNASPPNYSFKSAYAQAPTPAPKQTQLALPAPKPATKVEPPKLSYAAPKTTPSISYKPYTPPPPKTK